MDIILVAVWALKIWGEFWLTCFISYKSYQFYEWLKKKFKFLSRLREDLWWLVKVLNFLYLANFKLVASEIFALKLLCVWFKGSWSTSAVFNCRITDQKIRIVSHLELWRILFSFKFQIGVAKFWLMFCSVLFFSEFFS